MTDAAFDRLVEPHRRELLRPLLPDARLGRDAEDALQDALLGAWRALPRFEGRSSVRSWLYRIATNACLRARAAARSACCRSTTARRPIRTTAPAAPLVESVWIEPLPDERLGSTRLARLATSSARRRARVHRRAPASAGAAARGADPARRARLQRPRGRRGARHDAGVDRQRAAARAQGGRRAHARAHAAGDAARARRREAERDGRPLPRAWEARRRGRGQGHARRGRDLAMPPHPHVVPRARRGVRVPRAPTRYAARTARGTSFPDARPTASSPSPTTSGSGARALRRHGVALLTLRGDRIADITTFLIPEQFGRLGLALELGADAASAERLA